MGVDIYGYLNVRRVECITEPGKWCEQCDHLRLYNLDVFAERARDLPIIEEHAARYGTLVRYGCFVANGRTDSVSMSYSGYNVWRERLCRSVLGILPQILWEDPTRLSLPFAPLINFADNEGTISWTTAARISADFRGSSNGLSHRELFSEHRVGADDAWFLRKYDDLAKVFSQVATSRGVVRFS